MNSFNDSGRYAVVALAADDMFSDDAANSKKMKMLFMLIAAFVLYSDFYAPAPSVGHCAAITSAQ